MITCGPYNLAMHSAPSPRPKHQPPSSLQAEVQITSCGRVSRWYYHDSMGRAELKRGAKAIRSLPLLCGDIVDFHAGAPHLLSHGSSVPVITDMVIADTSL